MNNIRDTCSRFRSRSVHVLVDLTQHVGVAPIDLTRWGVSAAAFSAHKGLGCPTGLGGLYIAPDVLRTLKPVPPIVGAGAIANLPASLLADPNVHYHATAQRYGHLNLSWVGAVALNASLDFILGDMGISRLENHLRGLGRELVQRSKSIGVKVVGSCYAEHRAPHLYVLKLLHPGWRAQLRESQVFVSHYRCGVRVSFGFYNNVEDISSLMRSIQNGLKRGIPLA